MIKYKSYPMYEPSGVEWLGDIPQHWDVWRWKHTLSIPMQYGANEAALDDDRRNPRYIRITDMNSDGSLKDETFKSLPPEVACDYLLQDGDILVARTGATVGKSFIYKSDFGPSCFAGYLIKARTNANIVEPEFLYWFLQTDQYWKYISGSQIQATIQNVSAEKYGDFAFAFSVNKDERQRISNFLSHETAKIDTLIEEQKTLIRLLQEKRQAVISHAVTKGLNPDVPLKDSGVEWLGQVPEHWELTRFKFLCDNIIAGPFGSSITKDMYKPTGYKVYGQEQVIPNDFEIGDYFISEKDFSELSRYEVRTGEVLISCVGTFGKIAVFPDDAKPGIINPRLIKATLKKEHNPHFVREFLKSTTVYKQFELLSRGGTMGVINIAILNEILAAVPPKKEQELIAQFISEKKCKFRMLIEEAQQTVQLLQERRTALISATVTGKIDVRDWTPPAPQKEQPPKAVQAA